MTLDVSLEAIEADLRIAERGGQVATIAMARAQVRATLLAAQPMFRERHLAGPRSGDETAEALMVGAGVTDIKVEQSPYRDVFTVPKLATWEDRVTAAAMLLGIDEASLRFGLSPVGRLKEQEPALEPPAEPTDDDDTEDVFAEARKARSKK